MKFLHLSDLHLGKRVNEYSMIEDQKYILKQILDISDREKPDAVLIAGDVYDKSVPTAEAVEVLDWFLCALSERRYHVFVISGNHDSPERLAFGGKLLDFSGVHLSPVYHGEVLPISLDDQFGTVNIYMLPFVKPAHIKRFFPDSQIETYTQAIQVAIENMYVDTKERNVLLSHQFVTGAVRCESEEISVGGMDNVDAAAFEIFDYVALGHIHGPQNVVQNKIRYCGTPLKYSFSEVSHRKSVTVVELEEKGTVNVRTEELTPMHDMVEVRGLFHEVMRRDEQPFDYLAYLHVILTDEEDIPEAVGRLRAIYPNLMKISYDNTRTRENKLVGTVENVKSKSPLQLYEELYIKQNNQPLSDTQRMFMQEMIASIWEDEA